MEGTEVNYKLRLFNELSHKTLISFMATNKKGEYGNSYKQISNTAY